MNRISMPGLLIALAALCISGMPACDSGSDATDTAIVKDTGGSGVPDGDEGGRCFGNKTCNAGLDCASNICVRLPDAGAADTGSTDTGTEDTGTAQDTGATDTGAPDTGTPDVGQPDGGIDPAKYPRHTNDCTAFVYDPQRPNIDDPVKGSTLGALVGTGGTLTADGYTQAASITCSDVDGASYVRYQIPTSSCGRVEFDAKGLDSTFSCLPAGEEIFGMYDGTWEHPTSQAVRDDYLYNPYRASLVLSCEDAAGTCTPTWAGGLYHVGNDTLNDKNDCRAFASLRPFPFDPGTTYHFIISWSGDATRSTLQVNASNGLAGFDGVLRAGCGDYIAYQHFVTIGGTPAGMAPANAVFSNVKIWHFQP